MFFERETGNRRLIKELVCREIGSLIYLHVSNRRLKKISASVEGVVTRRAVKRDVAARRRCTGITMPALLWFSRDALVAIPQRGRITGYTVSDEHPARAVRDGDVGPRSKGGPLSRYRPRATCLRANRYTLLSILQSDTGTIVRIRWHVREPLWPATIRETRDSSRILRKRYDTKKKPYF